MPSEPTTQSSTDLINGASVALVGAGVLTFALFPLAVPLLILTGIALVPLLIPVVAIGILAAAIVLPIRVARSLRSRRARPPRVGAAAVARHRLQVSAR
jgi:hypothetical protein